jgi:HSP20 family molecular chaperone IbpA
MAQVAVEKIDGKKATGTSVINDLVALSDRIRQHAFERFEQHGRRDGFELEDWLSAEQDLLRKPESEMVEKDGTYKVRLNAPGFEAGEMKVIAQPDALIVKAASNHKHEKNEGNVCFCEFDQKTLFRRFDVPEPIAVDKVTASLENGVLQLLATKAKAEKANAEATKTIPATA